VTKEDYDNLDSAQCRNMAKNKLRGEDEKIAQKMVAYILNAKKENDPFKSEAFNQSRTIGNFLNENGGYKRMLLVARRIEVLSNELKYCEMFWDGIGEWMA
jgi:hypothetical protein